MNKRKSFIIILVFLLIVVGIALLITLNMDYFKEIINNHVQKYGYVGILVFSFFADLLEQPIGPEVPASIGVLFGLNFILVIIFSVIGSYMGSLVNFYIGRRYLGPRFEAVRKEKVDKKYYKLFNKYGGVALALAAISPIPWVAFCWLAGIFKMKLRQFIFWGLIPRFFRIFGIVGVVWYFKIFLTG